MKVEILKCGVLLIKPENSTESFALRAWQEKAIIQKDLLDNKDAECLHIDGSRIRFEEHP